MYFFNFSGDREREREREYDQDIMSRSQLLDLGRFQSLQCKHKNNWIRFQRYLIYIKQNVQNQLKFKSTFPLPSPYHNTNISCNIPLPVWRLPALSCTPLPLPPPFKTKWWFDKETDAKNDITKIFFTCYNYDVEYEYVREALVASVIREIFLMFGTPRSILFKIYFGFVYNSPWRSI